MATVQSSPRHPQESSLRQRSKAKRRVAIQRAAMRLFAEQGYENTTVAEIADAAEVAARTVSMYFATKRDLALSTSSDLIERLTAVFRADPELPFTELIDRWLVSELESEDADLMTLTRLMFDANPTLRGLSNAQLAEATGTAGPALVVELGMPAEHPMVRIVGAAIGGAVGEYLAVSRGRAVGKEHQEFMRFLHALVAAARGS